jgi:O-methyltransferase domain
MEPCFQGLPTFLAQTSYKDPSDPTHGPSQHGHNTTKSFFEVLASTPRLGNAFNNFMGMYGAVRPRWTDYYPVLERLSPPTSSNSDSVLLVDVGGGLGHDLLEFGQKFPDMPGKLILQDQPAVLSTISSPLPPRITATAHDFFTPQPVKHARGYYMHLIMHDWPDDRATVILKHIRDAMKPGYSKLLICENVVPDVGAPWQMTSLDWVMMAMLANRERREGQWKALLGGAGLKITGIWRKDEGSESLVEAVRDDE